MIDLTRDEVAALLDAANRGGYLADPHLHAALDAAVFKLTAELVHQSLTPDELLDAALPRVDGFRWNGEPVTESEQRLLDGNR